MKLRSSQQSNLRKTFRTKTHFEASAHASDFTD